MGREVLYQHRLILLHKRLNGNNRARDTKNLIFFKNMFFLKYCDALMNAVWPVGFRAIPLMLKQFAEISLSDQSEDGKIRQRDIIRIIRFKY